jgi:hypothetical protein
MGPRVGLEAPAKIPWDTTIGRTRMVARSEAGLVALRSGRRQGGLTGVDFVHGSDFHGSTELQQPLICQ